MLSVKEVQSRSQMVDIGRLSKRYYEECMPSGEVPFDMAAVYATVQGILDDPERQYMNLWIAYDDNRPVGFILASSTRFVYAWDRCARQENLYVIPEKRGTITALKLIRAFEEWARLLGCLQVFLGVARDDNKAEAKKIGKIFNRIGYGFAGTYYVKHTGAKR
jgi:GNAT superfamily N-acetyltransferase